jgi:hypothetical protein
MGARHVEGLLIERVDGELLVRGEDRDYLIDYAASTVTFTALPALAGSGAPG